MNDTCEKVYDAALFGYRLKALKDLQPGDPILTEKPLVLAASWETNCVGCGTEFFTKNTKQGEDDQKNHSCTSTDAADLEPCGCCPAKFCSAECCFENEDTTHAFECQFWARKNDQPATPEEALLIRSIGKLNESKEARELFLTQEAHNLDSVDRWTTSIEESEKKQLKELVGRNNLNDIFEEDEQISKTDAEKLLLVSPSSSARRLSAAMSAERLEYLQEFVAKTLEFETKQVTALDAKEKWQRQSVLEVVLAVWARLHINHFSISGHSRVADNCAGVFVNMALLEHSCAPNCDRVFFGTEAGGPQGRMNACSTSGTTQRADGALLVSQHQEHDFGEVQVRAIREIKKGEFLSHSYLPPLWPVLDRWRKLRSGKEFEMCGCFKCSEVRQLLFQYQASTLELAGGIIGKNSCNKEITQTQTQSDERNKSQLLTTFSTTSASNDSFCLQASAPVVDLLLESKQAKLHSSIFKKLQLLQDQIKEVSQSLDEKIHEAAAMDAPDDHGKIRGDETSTPNKIRNPAALFTAERSTLSRIAKELESVWLQELDSELDTIVKNKIRRRVEFIVKAALLKNKDEKHNDPENYGAAAALPSNFRKVMFEQLAKQEQYYHRVQVNQIIRRGLRLVKARSLDEVEKKEGTKSRNKKDQDAKDELEFVDFLKQAQTALAERKRKVGAVKIADFARVIADAIGPSAGKDQLLQLISSTSPAQVATTATTPTDAADTRTCSSAGDDRQKQNDAVPLPPPLSAEEARELLLWTSLRDLTSVFQVTLARLIAGFLSLQMKTEPRFFEDIQPLATRNYRPARTESTSVKMSSHFNLCLVQWELISLLLNDGSSTFHEEFAPNVMGLDAVLPSHHLLRAQLATLRIAATGCLFEICDDDDEDSQKKDVIDLDKVLSRIAPLLDVQQLAKKMAKDVQKVGDIYAIYNIENPWADQIIDSGDEEEDDCMDST
ncbi:unnamed protein product [Amoebophrya sp. A120]|nr:unnamed protein product [Amoebophrya sp. A120]|eukprot:GSA120T00023704001.1